MAEDLAALRDRVTKLVDRLDGALQRFDGNDHKIDPADVEILLMHVRELVDASASAAAAERMRLIGNDDDALTFQPGILDCFDVFAQHAPNGRELVWVKCGGDCGDEGNGTLLITARDLEGSQDGLTLSELAHQALSHWAEEHDA